MNYSSMEQIGMGASKLMTVVICYMNVVVIKVMCCICDDSCLIMMMDGMIVVMKR